MRWSSRLPLLLLLLRCLTPGAVRAAPGPDTFLLAIVRDDGLVRPVAVHARGRWRSPWPAPVKEAEVPVRLEDCPLAWWGTDSPPLSWTLHTSEAAPQPLPIDGITWVPTYCQQQVVLRSRAGIRQPLRPADGLRAHKRGVAVAGEAQLTVPRQIDQDSAEARALLDAVQPLFNRDERLMLAGDYFAVYTPSVDGNARDRMPVEALGIYEGPGRTGGPVYFVELQRRYPRRAPADLQWCDEVTYMSGWIYRGDGDRIETSLISNDVTSCTLDSVVRAIPHAVVETARGPVWLLEEYRPNGEAFALYLAPDRQGVEPLRRVFGGSCSGR